ncbi:MAG TPA: hypothetical protein VNH38_05375 [Candidatus Dormibacteraeota bacterium]|nr:hypothetical protein [Candidatus Dormibacteraeota bacterium]
MSSEASGPAMVRDRLVDLQLHVSGIRAVGVGIIAYLGVTLLLFHLLWSGGGGIVGFPPDNEQHVWELGWWAFALTHGINPFFTNYLTPPGHPIDLMWNNTTPLLALMALPLTLLAGPVASFNVLLIGAMWLTATSTFLCLRSFCSDRRAAWAGGLLFGFSPFMLINVSSGRLPWTSLYLLPVFLLLFWTLIVKRRGPRWRLGLATGVTVAAQLLLSEELLSTTFLIAALMAILLALVHRDRVIATLRYAGPPLVLGAAVALLICGYPLFMQFAGPGHAIHGTVVPVQHYVSGLLAPLVPTNYQMLHLSTFFDGLLRLEEADGFSAAYLGIPLVALVVYMAIRQYRDPITKWALVLMSVAFVLSMGSQLYVAGTPSGIPLPWDLLHRLPLLSLAAPGRLAVFVYLALAVVIVRFGTLEWPGLGRPLRLLLVVATLITLAPAGAIPVEPLLTPPLFRPDAAQGASLHGMVALVPPPVGSALPQDSSMVWQAEDQFRFKMPWGDIIQASKGNDARLTAKSALGTSLILLEEGGRPRIDIRSLVKMRAELRQWEVSAVVVGPTSDRAQIVQLLREVLGTGPELVGGTDLWRLPSPNTS